MYYNEVTGTSCNPTEEELNQLFQDYQDDLTLRDKHIKLLVSFNDSMDELLSLLQQPDHLDFTPRKDK